MDPFLKILLTGGLIIGMCWVLSNLGPRKDPKLFNKLIFWLLFVPVVGTAVGTLVIIWLKSHGLI